MTVGIFLAGLVVGVVAMIVVFVAVMEYVDKQAALDRIEELKRKK